MGRWKPNPTASTRTLNLNAGRDYRCCVLSWVVFSSAEWFGTEFREFASISVPRNGIPSCFLFRWKVWKGIPRVCFYSWSTGRNSELFSRLRKGSERNSENFLFRGTAGIPSEITICYVNSVFRVIIFLSEILNLISAYMENTLKDEIDETTKYFSMK